MEMEQFPGRSPEYNFITDIPNTMNIPYVSGSGRFAQQDEEVLTCFKENM